MYLAYWKKLLALISLYVGFSQIANAQVRPSKLPPGALFARCYTDMTRMYLPPSHQLLQAVIAGTISPVDACMQIFDKARVPGAAPNKINTADPEAVAVLNTFYNYVVTWFELKYDDPVQVPQTYTGFYDTHGDVSEEANHIVRTFFTGESVGTDQAYVGGVRYSETVTGDSEIHAVRQFATKVNPGSGLCDGYIPLDGTCTTAGQSSVTWSQLPDWNWQGGQGSTPGEGLVYGFIKRPPNDNNHFAADGTAYDTIFTGFGGSAAHPVAFAPENYGGGLLGSASYLFKNGAYTTAADGGLKMHRRWAHNSIEAMLCRSFPVLRMSDVATVVQQYNAGIASGTVTGEPIPFRQNTTCASCHYAMDPIAAIVRGIQFSSSQGQIDWNANGVYGFTNGNANYLKDNNDNLTWTYILDPPYKPRTNIPFHMQQSDPSFYTGYSQYPPDGQVMFRSYDGTLVSATITVDLAQQHPQVDAMNKLGTIFAETNDFYVCAASHLFEFFTGIRANLLDPGDPRNPPISAGDQVYQNIVAGFGTNLKNSQSIRAMVREIISSDSYQNLGNRHWQETP